MIDTDKYEGHTPGQWSVTSIRDGSIPWNTADEELCADAPLLLAEVKRLYGEPRVTINEWDYKPDGNADAEPLPCVSVYHGGCEYVGRLRLYKNEDGKVIE